MPIPESRLTTSFGQLAGSMDAQIRHTKLERRYLYEKFGASPPICTAKAGAGAATGTAGDVNCIHAGNMHGSYFIIGTQTIVGPVNGTNGLNLGSGDQTNGDGWEINPGGITARSKYAYTVGTDGCFLKAKLKPADASGCNPLGIGFRVAAAGNGTLTSYTEYAFIGIIGTSDPNLIKISTNLASAGAVLTDTTQTWADAAAKELAIYVTAAGVVTYTIDGLAPTVTAAFTFTSAGVLIPFVRHVFAATSPGVVDWDYIEVGGGTGTHASSAL